jgi:SNF2 family DNA or RNA helicase
MEDMIGKFFSHSKLEKKEYQYEGIKWIVKNEVEGIRGCLRQGECVKGGFISDEMGLGKTIMIVGSLFVNYLPKTLIVLPVALIEQWVSQIYKTTGHRALVFYGKDKKNLNLDDFEGRPIVITSYNCVSFEKNKKTGCLLHKIKWNRLVFDEAHHLRNHKTGRYIGCDSLKSDIRWIVSGTPVQNRRRDFINLCNFVGLPHSYYKEVSNIPNFILKRTKKQVGINLPDVVSDYKVVKWNNGSEKNISHLIHSYVFPVDDNSLKGGLSFRYAFSPISRLIAMLRARQCCVYPKLLIKGIDTDMDMDMDTDKKEELKLSVKEGLESSSKLDSVVSLILSRKDNGNGKLVFCHFRGEMDELSYRLKIGGIENVSIYDGRCSKRVKSELLKKKSDVLILQIQTGCEGLNLQDNYNEIYFVTPHWNPKIEDQAVGRCHRIGQKKKVFVFRFHMSGFYNEEDNEESCHSIENYINDVQKSKRGIISEIIEE